MTRAGQAAGKREASRHGAGWETGRPLPARSSVATRPVGFAPGCLPRSSASRDRDRYLHARVYSSITHKSENGGSNPRAADGGGDAQDVAGAHSGLSPSLGKAQKAEECDAGPRETLCRVR